MYVDALAMLTCELFNAYSKLTFFSIEVCKLMYGINTTQCIILLIPPHPTPRFDIDDLEYKIYECVSLLWALIGSYVNIANTRTPRNLSLITH
jgi:hypothetical protein